MEAHYKIVNYNEFIQFYSGGWDSEISKLEVNTERLIDLIGESPNYFYMSIDDNKYLGTCCYGDKNIYKSFGGLMFCHLNRIFSYMSIYKLSEEETQKIIEFFRHFIKNVNGYHLFNDKCNGNTDLMKTLNKEIQYQKRLTFFKFIWQVKNVLTVFENHDIVRTIATFI